MPQWFRMLTSLSEEEAASVLAGHPREAKARLGREVVGWLHDEAAAAGAAEEFDRRFKEKELPSEIPEVTLPAGARRLPNLLQEAGLAASTSEARRLIQQGGVRLDGEVQSDPSAEAVLGAETVLVQVGKRRIARVRGT
jgi:tyrosyl-tRNA synthetase